MMGKRNISLIILLLLLTACSRPGHQMADGSDSDDTVAVVASDYKDDLYDQGHTSACWIYAMCACIEREQLRQGDSVTLSRQWLMSHELEEQTIEYYLTNGAHDINMRGVGPEVLRLIHEYGLVPYVMERSCINNSRVLERKLKLLATPSSFPPHKNGEDNLYSLKSKIEELLPHFTVAYTHPEPPSHFANAPHGWDSEASFYYYSMRYTPWQFAQSIMYDQQWRFYASSAFHPWHRPFALEVADNHRYHQFMNEPMPVLYNMVVRSLRQGHPVYWEYGRVSRQENGGIATSDHAMAIVGIHKGKLLCLNSYGKDWGMHGYCLVSRRFFLNHTCDIGVVQSPTNR